MKKDINHFKAFSIILYVAIATVCLAQDTDIAMHVPAHSTSWQNHSIVVHEKDKKKTTTSDIHQVTQQDLKVAPNVIQDDRFVIQSRYELEQVDIMDYHGRFVAGYNDFVGGRNTQNLSDYEVDVQNFEIPKGVYWVRIRLQDGQTVVRKIVKLD